MNQKDRLMKLHAGVMAAFAADALALGVHWVYDVAQIKERYGRLDYLTAPEIAPFHKNRQKGNFTHYGDQMQVLLESLHHCNRFDLADFATRWQSLFDRYDGYLDKATKTTLSHFQAGRSPKTAGSDSTDLGGAARMVPIALFHGNDADTFIDSARQQTAMTHNHPLVLETARFFALAALETASGADPAEASGLQQISSPLDLPFLISWTRAFPVLRHRPARPFPVSAGPVTSPRPCPAPSI